MLCYNKKYMLVAFHSGQISHKLERTAARKHFLNMLWCSIQAMLSLLLLFGWSTR